MAKTPYPTTLGLSEYAVTAYLTLLRKNPLNGSQLSRLSGIPRPRIYDVLRNLKQKGFVAECREGLYVPLPPDEMLRRLQRDYEADLTRLKHLLEEARGAPGEDFIWTLKGYDQVMAKAREMVREAREEIYVRVYPEEGRLLNPDLRRAEQRGVPVKYIAMEPMEERFALQVVHPRHEEVRRTLGGRSFDLVVDRREILGGLFLEGAEDQSVINWGRNRWFVLAGRDSLRHDFFHYFLYKTYHQKEPLTEAEDRLYRQILEDM
ncbi:transcriptional regulator TrmB [Desulfacinum infernum DSM 9756]|uniref:Transcriptional regulator TrmB n=1 Tax=Desulfacinum infernum DSM 9756 TaxID=1121391 RepID=A0A1M5CGA2_9BACT|nr:TrmB family transcriptional regulator [Desulfacinum infernum]SHF53794.1 transcriptional regulator TrmB [Desulfacinum infernum DSM 9756]